MICGRGCSIQIFFTGGNLIMNVLSHISTLQQKHDKIKAVVQENYSHHVISPKIIDLKKQKLALKDEIENLKRQAAG
jgi:hypothetical protein